MKLFEDLNGWTDEEIKIICVNDTYGRYTTQRHFKCGDIISIRKYTWKKGMYPEYEFSLVVDGYSIGYYQKRDFKILAEYRDARLEEILKD